MRVYSLKYKQKINRPIEEVFSFFSNPENLSTITPSKLNFNILTPKPIKMYKGQVIDYTIRLLRIKIHWRTLITEYNPPFLFIDQQIKGPYILWHHKHEFKNVNDGVEIIDTVKYIIPFSIFGRILHRIWIKRNLENIFKYRKIIINNFFKQNNKENK